MVSLTVKIEKISDIDVRQAEGVSLRATRTRGVIHNFNSIYLKSVACMLISSC